MVRTRLTPTPAGSLVSDTKMNATIKVQNGNKEIEIRVVGSREWAGGENARVYFDLDQGKRNVLKSLYEIIAGDSRDEVVEVAGRRFAYALGIDCNSNTKRASANDAAVALIAQLVAEVAA